MIPAGLYPNTQWAKDYKKFGFELIGMDMREYSKFTLRYNIKMLMPIELWDDAPYTLNGNKFKDMLQKTGNFYKEMGSHNINVFVKDVETALLASALDINSMEFSNKITEMVLTGDSENLRKEFKDINEKINERL